MTPSSLLALLLASAGGPAVAQEPPAPTHDPAAVHEPKERNRPFTFTDDLEVRYWVKPDRLADFPDRAVFNYVEQVNRLSIKGAFDEWTVWSQIDQVSLWANRYVLDGHLYMERDLLDDGLIAWPGPSTAYVNIEKLALRYDKKHVSVTAGDFYGAFGRGLALNVNRNVDIDIDTSIQGAKVMWRPGAWDVTALVGQLNRQQVFQDNPNLSLEGDYRHAVAGVRAERFGLGPANLGAHVVGYGYVQDPGVAAGFRQGLDGVDVAIGGVTAELVGLGGVDWFAEVDGFSYPTTAAAGGEADPGYAAYASASFYPGRTAWLIEAKRYRNAEIPNRPVTPELYELVVGPTLEYERAVTEDSAAALNSDDVWGGRIHVDWSAAQGVVPYAALGVFRDEELGGLHFNRAPETIVHPMLGLELTVEHTAVLLNAGYRVDQRDEGYGADRQIHADLDLKFPLGKGFLGNFASGVERYRWGDNAFQQTDYFETENAISIQKGSDVALIAYLDYTDNPLVDSVGNLRNVGALGDLGEALYGAVEVQVKPTTSTTIKAFYGAYKAGIRCSGGQCRLLPGFEGARVSFVGTF